MVKVITAGCEMCREVAVQAHLKSHGVVATKKVCMKAMQQTATTVSNLFVVYEKFQPEGKALL